MGGRGGQSGISSIKSQIKSMASQGKMPVSIAGGTAEQRAAIFREIDKQYPMPNTKTVSIVDQGDGIWINFGDSVRRASYPSGKNASEAEKRGVKKWLMWRNK